MTPEQPEWSGSPSQWSNAGVYLLCLLLALTLVGAVIGVPWAIARWLITRNVRYQLTNQRLLVHRGVFAKVIDELELYRIKDSKVDEPLLLRMVGCGNVLVISGDQTTPRLDLHAIKDARAVRERLRTLVEERREAKGVRITEFE